MAVTVMQQEIVPMASSLALSADDSLTVFPLMEEHEAKALAFLAARPLHTVFMASLIRDNGIISPLNRGTFYGCSDPEGQLEGIALIGHAILIETASEKALQEFARLAQQCPNAYLIRGEQDKIERFWQYYSEYKCQPHLICRELLLGQQTPATDFEAVPGLRLAAPDDLEQVMAINDAMAIMECGISPFERDPEGFRQRTMRRIELGRIWVWTEQERMIFKSDVLAVTPEAIYLEGVAVNAQERGKGYGLRCLSQLSRNLLAQTESLCLVVNEQAKGARAFYRKAGYRVCGFYDTIYL